MFEVFGCVWDLWIFVVRSKTRGKACDSLLHLSVIFVVRKARGLAYNSFWVYEPETGAYNGCSPRFLPTVLCSCFVFIRGFLWSRRPLGLQPLLPGWIAVLWLDHPWLSWDFLLVRSNPRGTRRPLGLTWTGQKVPNRTQMVQPRPRVCGYLSEIQILVQVVFGVLGRFIWRHFSLVQIVGA